MRRVWHTLSSGMDARTPPDSTRRAGTEVSETGTQISTVVPWPLTVSTEISPLRRAVNSRTMSRPMPRPEMPVGLSAVVIPPRRIRSMASRNPRDSAPPGSTTPFFTTARRIAARSIPPPSSRQSNAPRFPRRSMPKWMRPQEGLPAAARTAGLSRPWATALRTSCKMASRMVSSTRASSRMSPPAGGEFGLLAEGDGGVAHGARDGGENGFRRQQAEAIGAFPGERERALRFVDFRPETARQTRDGTGYFLRQQPDSAQAGAIRRVARKLHPLHQLAGQPAGLVQGHGLVLHLPKQYGRFRQAAEDAFYLFDIHARRFERLLGSGPRCRRRSVPGGVVQCRQPGADLVQQVEHLGRQVLGDGGPGIPKRREDVFHSVGQFRHGRLPDHARGAL